MAATHTSRDDIYSSANGYIFKTDVYKLMIILSKSNFGHNSYSQKLKITDRYGYRGNNRSEGFLNGW